MIPLPPGLRDGSGSALERQRAGNEMKVIIFFAENDHAERDARGRTLGSSLTGEKNEVVTRARL